MATVSQQIQEVYTGLLGRAADSEGLAYWTAEIDAGTLTIEQLRANIVNEQPEYATGLGAMTRAQTVNELYNRLFERDAEAEGLDYWVNGGGADVNVDQLILALSSGAAASDRLVLDNKVEAAQYYTANTETYAADSAKAAVDTVDGTSASVDASKSLTDGGTQSSATTFTLTQRADNLNGSAEDDTFKAPVTQNEQGTGQLANSFETGDVLAGGKGTDVLRADLIDTGTIQDTVNSAAISAETSGIEQVYFRAQRGNGDNEIDAEKMSGVTEWWTDNSRANITIEDIRSSTASTTFGMRETDPGVGFNNYFNAQYLEGDTSATSALTLNIYEGPQGSPSADELKNITVKEIKFSVDSEEIILDTQEIRDANTWAELESALTDALAAVATAEGIALVNVGNGQFVFEDAQGRAFQVVDGDALGLSVTNNITVTNSLAAGREEVNGPTITNVSLDAAGNGSQGGALNVGAMSGLRGVEVVNVDVDQDSHLQSLTSFNQTPGQYGTLRNGGANEFVQVVNLSSKGAEGDLTLGRSDATSIDGRVMSWGDFNADGVVDFNNSGLINVREVNGDGFAGALNLAATLDNNAVGRYLDDATEEVEFNYTASGNNDTFRIADLSTLGVSADEDFAMNIKMGAGDDRLILNVPNVSSTTVDGETGANSIVVAQSKGTTTGNTFEGFANFQTYEIEGTGAAVVNNTTHDFTSMSGIDNVVIATDANGAGGDNTTLRDLEADQNVTVSGKNQTVGNNSTGNQSFGTVALTDDAGAARTVTLDNTARLSNVADGVNPQDGILSVNNLTVNNTATGTSATRTLTIESTGERNVANAVAAVNATAVNTLELTGTQELTVNVNALATAPATSQAPLSITGAELTGNLNLALNGTQLNQITGAGTDTITGTAGDSDTFMMYGALAAGNQATVTGFETVQLGSYGGDTVAVADDTLFGDLVMPATVVGTLDNTGVAATNYVVADVAAAGLALTNLGNGVTVAMGDSNKDVNGATVNGQALVESVTLQSGAAAGVPAAQIDVNYISELATGQIHDLTIDGYQTVNLDVAHAANAAAGVGDGRAFDLTLDAANEDARILNVSGGDTKAANNAGVYDVLDLTSGANELNVTLTQIDVSDYAGNVTFDMVNDVVVATTQTDVEFLLSKHDAAIQIAESETTTTGVGAAGVINDITHNSIFRFAGDKGDENDQSVWAITGDVIGAGVGGGDIDNITRFDVSDLGITSFDQLDLASFAGMVYSEAQIDESTALTDDAATWEIDLTGATITGALTEDNFIFA